jgi:hypothetical protein
MTCLFLSRTFHEEEGIDEVGHILVASMATWHFLGLPRLSVVLGGLCGVSVLERMPTVTGLSE